MLRCLRILGVSICLAPIPAQAVQLQVPDRTENFPRGSLGGQPLPSYQAGYVFSRNQSHTAIWVDRAKESPGTAIEKMLDLPDSFRHSIREVAVAFDGSIAVTASVMDKEGRFVSVIAWLRVDGSLIRAVRTSPFAAADIGFTADGSLWAFGIVKQEDMREEEPVHDVLRQYAPDGRLIRTLLPRSAVSTKHAHPISYGFLATSRNYAAMLSSSAKKFALISTGGIVVHEGALPYPEDFQMVIGAVTDSGRIFVQGRWSGSEGKDNYPNIPLFEVNFENKRVDLVDTDLAIGENEFGMLVGSEKENLIFHVRAKDGQNKIVWSEVK